MIQNENTHRETHSLLQSHLHACSQTMDKMIRISHCWIVANDYSYCAYIYNTLLVGALENLSTLADLSADFHLNYMQIFLVFHFMCVCEYVYFVLVSFFCYENIALLRCGRQHTRMYTFKSGRKQLAIIYTMYFTYAIESLNMENRFKIANVQLQMYR